jgi:hypothetical protein
LLQIVAKNNYQITTEQNSQLILLAMQLGISTSLVDSSQGRSNLGFAQTLTQTTEMINAIFLSC